MLIGHAPRSNRYSHRLHFGSESADEENGEGVGEWPSHLSTPCPRLV